MAFTILMSRGVSSTSKGRYRVGKVFFCLLDDLRRFLVLLWVEGIGLRGLFEPYEINRLMFSESSQSVGWALVLLGSAGLGFSV